MSKFTAWYNKSWEDTYLYADFKWTILVPGYQLLVLSVLGVISRRVTSVTWDSSSEKPLQGRKTFVTHSNNIKPGWE